MDLHSMPNLALRGDEKWEHMQFITHRFDYRPGDGLPENGWSTLAASAKRGFRNHEFDVVYTLNGPIVDHDYRALRARGLDIAFAELSMGDVVGHPILIQKFQNNDFAPGSIVSNDLVSTPDATIAKLFELVPDGSGFPDCRNMDICRYTAELSHKEVHTRLHPMFYTFTIHDGQDFADTTETFDPHPEWKTRVKPVLNFYPSELITVAQRRGMDAENVEDLFNVGKALMMSFRKAGITLFGFVAMNSGLSPEDFENFEELSKEEQLEIYGEQAMRNLVEWIRSSGEFPNVKIGSGTRAYDCSIPQPDGSRVYYTYHLMTGKLLPWSASPVLRKIRELYATPGVAEKYMKPDMLIADELDQAALPCCGIPADDSLGFRHPRFDTRPETTQPETTQN
ncbi:MULTISPECIES: hypothetical protein [unclassified Neorhizobium]|uniref:hypothetical protein n=1 Tax=unclassified Neorhizobium TaxID=2629175 RepID=UPI001FF280A3|nr:MULTISPECIES: hypothetical protein [unclassified Neorhizobium]MCJ9672229.1 hypothetical protein [Neorhizobium sp. SHOUNA12B]MCJ9748058.1 hypothetical protein [Neorhizobium sp. SHOUNA12A]